MNVNRFLINLLEKLNIIVAVLIILLSTISGLGAMSQIGFLYGLAIILSGIVGAALLCGILATIFDIRRQPVTLNTHAERQSGGLGPVRTSSATGTATDRKSGV